MLKQITSNIQKAAVGAATLIHNTTQDEAPAAELRPSQALIDSTPKRPKSHKKPAAAPAEPAPVPAFSKPKAKGSRAVAAVPAFVEEASMQRHTTSSMAPPKAAGGSKRKAAPVWEEQVGPAAAIAATGGVYCIKHHRHTVQGVTRCEHTTSGHLDSKYTVIVCVCSPRRGL